MAPRTLDSELAARLYSRAEAERWGLTLERFTDALTISAAQVSNPESLHLQDLALALACAEGNEAAWNHFVLSYRAALYRAAEAIDRTGNAREAADALYGELFGVREKNGARQSLFRYYHGRAKLDTWLRAVLAQRHVDRIRATRKLDALPEEDGPSALEANDTAPNPDRDRFTSAMQQALSSAIAALEARDRLRLRLYYAQQMKLGAIGKMLGEHEATVSRHLTRTRADLRKAVDALLRQQHGFDDRAVSDSFELIASDPGSLDLAQLVGAGTVDQHINSAIIPTIGKFASKERSNE